MFKSGAFTFGLLASSLVMLSAMPVLNQQNNFLSNTAMAQGYNYGDNSYSKYPNIQPRIINMSVKQARLKASL
jgi:hypothetical protein